MHEACRITVGELHTAFCQFIDVRRFVVIRSVATEVSPAKIVDHQENDIWPLLGKSDTKREEKRGE
jgi:hypothetical protein